MDRDVMKAKKKIEARRRQTKGVRDKKNQTNYEYFPQHQEAPYHEPEFYVWREKEQASNPKQAVSFSSLTRWMTSIALFLLTAILFQSSTPALDGARQFVSTSFEKEFEFATMSAWYEEQFGRPLTLLPPPSEGESQPPAIPAETSQSDYAVPVSSGRITESFSENGQGIILETNDDAKIEAARGGIVRFAGPHEELGVAVAVQHYDGGESWYGFLEDVNVKLYDHVQAGAELGRASMAGDKERGAFYFALKEQDEFIDPIEVIPFE